MITLVCGGRAYYEIRQIETALNMLPTEPSMIIHGGAKGADLLATLWATRKGIHSAEIKALWDWHNKSAGYKRNIAMLLLRPEYCVAFPGGKGTKMMVSLCETAGISVWLPYGT